MDEEVITFKVKGEHVKPAELRKKMAQKRGLEAAEAAASAATPLKSPAPPRSTRKPGSALRDRTNIATDSKPTIKSLKDSASCSEAGVPEPAPAFKRKRLVRACVPRPVFIHSLRHASGSEN